MDRRDPFRCQPGWLLLLCGWLFASATLAMIEARRDLRAAPPRAPPPVDLATSPPRELGRLPGIGPTRAAAIARLRWARRGRELILREVRGIGPRTEERVRRWLAEQPDGRAQPSFGE